MATLRPVFFLWILLDWTLAFEFGNAFPTISKEDINIMELGLSNVDGSSLGKPQKHCTNIPDFIRKLAAGVDASNLDYLAPSTVPNGFKGTLVEFTCRKGRKIKVGDTLYEWPDQISNWYPISNGEKNELVKRIRSRSDAKSAVDSGASLGGGYGPLQLSASFEYKSLSEKLARDDRDLFDFRYSVAILNFDLDPDIELDDPASTTRASEYIRNKLKGKSYAEEPRSYNGFVELYGTHIQTSGKFGGAINALTVVDNDLIKSTSATDVDATIKVNVLEYINVGNAKFHYDTSQNASYDSKAIQSTVRCFGGPIDQTCENFNISTWQANIILKPHLLTGQAHPVTNYINAKELKEGLDTAICRKLSLSYLRDVRERLSKIEYLSYSEKYRQTIEEVESQSEKYIATLENLHDAESHLNACVAVKNDLAPKVDKALNVLREGSVAFENLAATDIRQGMLKECKKGYQITTIAAHHDDYYKDRSWAFQCQRSPFRSVKTKSCTWSPRMTKIHKSFKFQCSKYGGNGFIAGFESEFNKKKADRTWRFKCCSLPSKCVSSCEWTKEINGNAEDFDFQVPKGKYLAGFQSRVEYRRYKLWFLGKKHMNTDRMWRLQLCQVESC